MDPRIFPLSLGKKSLAVKSLSLSADDCYNFKKYNIALNCKNLVNLYLGQDLCALHDSTGAIWDGFKSINDYPEEWEAFSDIGDMLLDVKDIADIHTLESIHINHGVQLKSLNINPPKLEQLTILKDLRLCPIGPSSPIDFSRDERNLRVLAQSSKKLKILDIRGCYLRIFSLGWLETEHLEALHVFYQVPAVSILFKWGKCLKYLTLSKIARNHSTFRSYGPIEPGEELDACLEMLASISDSPLQQLDVRKSDCTIKPVIALVKNCKKLEFLDTQNCKKIPKKYRLRCTSRSQILNLFGLTATTNT